METSSKVAIFVSAALFFYLISPPIVYKVSSMTGFPMSDKSFTMLDAPLIPLVENVKPYAWLIALEADILNLD